MIKSRLRTFPMMTVIANVQLLKPCTSENLAKELSDGRTLYLIGQVLLQETWPVLQENCNPKKAIADSIKFLSKKVSSSTFEALVC